MIFLCRQTQVEKRMKITAASCRIIWITFFRVQWRRWSGCIKGIVLHQPWRARCLKFAFLLCPVPDGERGHRFTGKSVGILIWTFPSILSGLYLMPVCVRQIKLQCRRACCWFPLPSPCCCSWLCLSTRSCSSTACKLSHTTARSVYNCTRVCACVCVLVQVSILNSIKV